MATWTAEGHSRKEAEELELASLGGALGVGDASTARAKREGRVSATGRRKLAGNGRDVKSTDAQEGRSSTGTQPREQETYEHEEVDA
eukprot:CAMPEP_0175892220 /NCGR_PEP_ID=MMETSP0107_2-20121207/48799_1 /TAXON_ID=195067 ORGANISM="Goniomonas pacifica, Strain CCMP1869" /NCGR_SAMPLE_ID=MMETSP0107_2 /ASSEMBLY_ACC=CAM_ASM_000203 /LENGTH=86 /DNA_ID=CAMNT_0017213145 /DNA_START=349 /DNA_END=609 /DNA_ORIENTATION=-